MGWPRPDPTPVRTGGRRGERLDSRNRAARDPAVAGRDGLLPGSRTAAAVRAAAGPARDDQAAPGRTAQGFPPARASRQVRAGQAPAALPATAGREHAGRDPAGARRPRRAGPGRPAALRADAAPGRGRERRKDARCPGRTPPRAARTGPGDPRTRRDRGQKWPTACARRTRRTRFPDTGARRPPGEREEPKVRSAGKVFRAGPGGTGLPRAAGAGDGRLPEWARRRAARDGSSGRRPGPPANRGEAGSLAGRPGAARRRTLGSRDRPGTPGPQDRGLPGPARWSPAMAGRALCPVDSPGTSWTKPFVARRAARLACGGPSRSAAPTPQSSSVKRAAVDIGPCWVIARLRCRLRGCPDWGRRTPG